MHKKISIKKLLIRRKFFGAVALLFLSFSAMSQDDFVFVQDGRLYYPNGEEVALWGVNLQSMISWEYNAKMRDAGIPKDAEAWKKMTDKSLDELEIMGANYIRVHLTPADFTDADGNLVETIYLDLLDYTTAEAAKRGMRLCYAFLNHMGGYEVASSFMKASFDEARAISTENYKLYRKALNMFDEGYVAASKNYMKQLLNRVNPYSNTTYKADTSIIVWGIMNEPIFMNYEQLKEYTEEYNRFKSWLSNNGLVENNGVNYFTFRKARVKGYINEIHDLIRSTGSVQPVEWSLNWHRFRNGRIDVFEAVAESKVEVVSFCTYPGQGTATQLGGGNYQNFTGDLSDYDFTGWFQNGYNELSWYGWTMSSLFSSKAKTVYEFEGFYNQSSYIYPAIADFQRSLGAQAGAMWHYSQPDYAQYNSGSHILNLKCTPNKAAGFAVASKIYQNTLTQQPYHPDSPVEYQADNYMYSFSDDIAIYSDDDSYFYSASISPGQLPAPSANVKHIMGIGNSEVVEYSGNGNYRIDILGDTMEINIQPDVSYNHTLSSREDALITNLHYDTIHSFNLRFWDRYGKYEIYAIKDGSSSLVQTEFFLDNFKIKPGKYKIYLGDTLFIPETEAPTEPSNLSIDNIKPTKVDLSWDASTNAYIDHYIVYVNGVQDTIVDAPGTRVTIDKLNCDGSYDISVKAISGAGNESPISNTVPVLTDICDVVAPSKPANLTSSNITPISVQLTWEQSTDNIEVTEYIVYTNGEKKNSVPFPDTSIIIKGLFCNSSYAFSVRAVDEAGNLSEESKMDSVRTSACSGYITFELWEGIAGHDLPDLSTIPEYPDYPTNSDTLSSMEISTTVGADFLARLAGALQAPETGTYYFWIAGDNGVELSLSTDATEANKRVIAYHNSWTGIKEWDKFTSQKSTGINLKEGKVYYIEALLKGDANYNHLAVGWRKPSDDDTILIIPGSVLMPLMDATAPTVPTLTTSNITENSVDLSWTESTDDSESVAYFVLQNEVILDTVNENYVSISGLSSGFSYNFTVKAFDLYGNTSPASNVETVITIDNESPTVPANLAASEITGTSCVLAWDPSSDNAIVSEYEIYKDGSLEIIVNDTFCTIAGLEMITNYSFSVKAKDLAGNTSTMSANIDVTTLDTEAPSVPANLVSSNISGNSCNLSWKSSIDNHAVAAYEVLMDGVVHTTVLFSYVTISDLTNASSYIFTVRAKDDAGNVSDESNSVTVTTLDTEAPVAPANLKYSNITGYSVDLNWETSDDNVGVSAYNVYKNSELEHSVTDTFTTVSGLSANSAYEFSIRAIDASGNISGSSNSVSILTIGISESVISTKFRDKALFYPNPVSDKLYFKNISNCQLTFYGIDGKVLFKTEYVGNEVDLSGLEKGIYILRITGEVNTSCIIVKSN